MSYSTNTQLISVGVHLFYCSMFSSQPEQFWPIFFGNLLNNIKAFLIIIFGFILAKPRLLVPAEKNQLEICKSSLQMLFSFPLLFYCQFCNRHKEFYLLIRLIDLIDWLRHLVWLKSLMYQKFLLSNNSFFDMVHLIESIMDWRAAYYFKCWPPFYFVFDYGEWHSKYCY